MNANELYRILESKRKPTKAFLDAIRKEFLSANWVYNGDGIFTYKMPTSKFYYENFQSEHIISWLQELGYNARLQAEDRPAGETYIIIECTYTDE